MHDVSVVCVGVCVGLIDADEFFNDAAYTDVVGCDVVGISDDDIEAFFADAF